MFRVAVVNAKGGVGKTTLATNLASYYAAQGLKTALIDFDSQGSSSYWAGRRPESLNPIQAIPAYQQQTTVTQSWFMRPERSTERVIIDTPSGLDLIRFQEMLLQSHAVIIPVLPSSIDIHAVAGFISELLLRVKLKREDGVIAVVANRAKRNTLVYQRLEKFLSTLGIPFVATLRDTQQYIKACEAGEGIFDLRRPHKKDIESWQPLLAWLQQREQVYLAQQHLKAQA